MPQGRASTPLGALALLLAGPAVAGADGGDAMIARARAAESAQLRVLSRAPVALHTTGRFGDGKTMHTFESFRRVQYRSDGTVSNIYESGQVDGKPVKEEELRKAMGAREQAKEQGDVLTWALAPLSSPDMEVSAVGPTRPASTPCAARSSATRWSARSPCWSTRRRRELTAGNEMAGRGLAGRSPGERVDVRRGRLAGRVPFELLLQARLNRAQREVRWSASRRPPSSSALEAGADVGDDLPQHGAVDRLDQVVVEAGRGERRRSSSWP